MTAKIRFNVYTCEKCAGFTTTADVDEGTTAFTIRCRAGKGCKGMAHSNFYPQGPIPAHIPPPTHEWYKPVGAEKRRLCGANKGHVDLGGLLIRPITKHNAARIRSAFAARREHASQDHHVSGY